MPSYTRRTSAKKGKRKKTPLQRVKDILEQDNVYDTIDVPLPQERYLLKGMTSKMIRFCEEINKGKNITEAYALAGYKARGDMLKYRAAQLYRQSKVQRYLKWLRDRKRARNEIIADNVLKELAVIAYSNIKDYMVWDETTATMKPSSDLPDELTAAIAEIQATTNNHGPQIKFKLYGKMQALELLSRYLGIIGEGKSPQDEDEIRNKAQQIKDYVNRLFDTVPRNAEGNGA